MACDPSQLEADAKCLLTCIAPGMQLPVLISLFCQIRDNGGGGGVPALPNNQIFVGNAANVATAVAMSGDATIINTGAVTLANSATTRTHLGLGTTDAPQFARLGVGAAASATVAFTVDGTALAPAITTSVFVALHPGGGAGDDVSVFQCDCTVGSPYFTLGQVALNDGGFFQYHRPSNTLRFAVHGHPNPVFISTNANPLFMDLTVSGDIYVPLGFFICGGLPGLYQTFDIGAGNTTITFTGGIATAIA